MTTSADWATPDGPPSDDEGQTIEELVKIVRYSTPSLGYSASTSLKLIVKEAVRKDRQIKKLKKRLKGYE